MTLLLPTRLTFTIFTEGSIHAYIRLVKYIAPDDWSLT